MVTPRSQSVVSQILLAREQKNERYLAIVRFIFLSLSATLDLLSFLGVLDASSTPSSALTIVLDGLFLSFAAFVMVLLLRKVYFPALKYIVMSFDYGFITLMLVLDPSVPREGAVVYWVALTAALFLFFLNLLRFSRGGTIFAAVLSLAQFVSISLLFGNGEMKDYPQLFLALGVFFFIGYSVTASNRNMMAEVNAKQMMERYLSPQLVGELFKQQFSLSPGGKTQRVTILFSDIRSFTTLAEALPAAQVVELLNAYLSVMTEVIFANRGTLDKFIGDAIMTVFGSPVPAEDDAQRALTTALQMQRALEQFNAQRQDGGAPLVIGIGIHTGDVIAGNIGSERRLDFTVIGDSVNLSSRIEGLTKVYGCPILVSETTHRELTLRPAAASYLFREIDTVVVKGKSQSVRIFEVLPFRSPEEEADQRRKASVYEAGLAAFRVGQFAQALDFFEQQAGDPPSEALANRCRSLLGQTGR